MNAEIKTKIIQIGLLIEEVLCPTDNISTKDIEKNDERLKKVLELIDEIQEIDEEEKNKSLDKFVDSIAILSKNGMTEDKCIKLVKDLNTIVNK